MFVRVVASRTMDPDRPVGKLYRPEDDVLVTLRATGILKEPPEGKESQSVRIIRDIKASGELPPKLVAAWRTKGLVPPPSSSYEPRLFCSHALTRTILKKWARVAGLREGEIDLIANESMWKRKKFPVRMRPAAGPEEFHRRKWLSSFRQARAASEVQTQTLQ